MIEDKLKRPLADKMLFGRLANGGQVHVDVQDKEGQDSEFTFGEDLLGK